VFEKTKGKTAQESGSGVVFEASMGYMILD